MMIVEEPTTHDRKSGQFAKSFVNCKSQGLAKLRIFKTRRELDRNFGELEVQEVLFGFA
jgi:hypothetical protein